MEKVKLKFYTIDRCGYRKYGEEGEYLTDITDTLDNLKEWIEDLTLQQTLTTNALSAATERTQTYCIDVIKSANNNYLLVTWNRSESTNGAISSIHQDEPVATASTNVESTDLPDDHIPGYATYFWFIPEDNILATIKFNHISNGHIAMNNYLKGFLTRHSKYTVVVEDEENRGNYEIVGYGESPDNYDEDLHPYFSSSLKRLPGKIDYIKDRRRDIKKVIRKTTITQEVTSDANLFEKLMYHLGTTRPHALNDTIELKYEMKTNLNSSELDDIIASWRQDHEQTWDDVGFVISGNNNPLWLSSEVPSKEIDIDVIRHNDEFVNFESLLNELDNRVEEFRRIYNGDN